MGGHSFSHGWAWPAAPADVLRHLSSYKQAARKEGMVGVGGVGIGRAQPPVLANALRHLSPCECAQAPE